MLESIGIVTSGSDAACDLLNKIKMIIDKVPVTIPFIITEFPPYKLQLKSKIIEIRSKNLTNREHVYEYYMGEFLKFPTKKLLFIEHDNIIPDFLNRYYDCYVLSPSIKDKTGTWEAVLGEVILTKSDTYGCHIIRCMENSKLPVIQYRMNTKKDFYWNVNRKKDITKSDLYLSLQSTLRRKMPYVIWLFLDTLINHKIEFKNSKVFIDDILMLGGLDATGFLNSKGI